ncbi:hypothetical protein AGABI1DRAFT_112257 [Agaricus bisporus var. burnettii JB137-S8]|uniref:Methyltransferase domain-containing protein n=1 Tax=Agaricus bisporus var. burnettii (strain JB137-S8 / ATCC MYA-4627 / FGSC 10392) TaxID=597362 RepID=K5XFZ9_AGABU|nr:uncharacterized protein AGABI1DRAFT_112257 [Agaricus bisporus var. burnettii JB137-S8]EKM82147.1 hypothetical protein AGABI1DRAFT_112257 [Agaricus bisporus var. burnettii JB137-S8]
MVNLTFENKLIWAPVTLESGAVVLDSGTGSGHWLLSLAKEVPSTVVLRGIDISPRMFPSPTTIPDNMSLMSHSITSLPEDWTNTVTLIHQRLLVAAFQADQWKTAVSEMYRVLAPGGWVQLFEPREQLLSPLEAITNHKTLRILERLMADTRHIVNDVVDHLQHWLEEAGFVNLTIQKRGMPIGSWAGERGVLSMEATLGAFEAMKPLVIKEGGLGIVSNEEEYDAALADLRRLCDDTPDTYFQYWLFTAQKPLPKV